MTGNHAHEYIGRHRKDTGEAQQPDDGSGTPPTPVDGLLRRTLELFTHGTQPLHLKEK